MLYLPGLFVYHCDVPPGSAESERKRRLLRFLITPAMIMALTPGVIDWMM